jgi:class 3 adenylate cyclase
MHDDVAPGSHDSPVERRLATILMADVAGYSRMMGENEERTVRVLRGHRAIFDEFLKAHRGRVFNTAGDAILAEFPSAVEAVRCATEIQAALRTRNEHLPEDQRMWFRIGVNLGDVIVQEGDLLGDGVNVAARIQTVAEPGGICISGSVYDQIQNKLSLHFRQLGERSFKNIAQPVRTFSITEEGGSAPRLPRERRSFPAIAAAALAVLMIVIAGASYWLYRENETRAAEARRAEEAQRAVAARQATEDALKAEQQKLAQANEAREAKLRAELQSAKDALVEAEAAKRKAEQDRTLAQAAQREARLQSELKATQDALQRAADSEKKAEDARQAAEAAMKSAEAAARKAADLQRQAAAPRTTSDPKAATQAARAAASTAMAASAASPATTGVDRFDGAYTGRMCSTNPDGSPRCWPVTLTVSHGTLYSTWPSRFNDAASHAKGTITPDGTVNLALDGFAPNGHPLAGTMSGSFADNRISATGAWNNKAPLSVTWSANR